MNQAVDGFEATHARAEHFYRAAAKNAPVARRGRGRMGERWRPMTLTTDRKRIVIGGRGQPVNSPACSIAASIRSRAACDA